MIRMDPPIGIASLLITNPDIFWAEIRRASPLHVAGQSNQKVAEKAVNNVQKWESTRATRGCRNRIICCRSSWRNYGNGSWAADYFKECRLSLEKKHLKRVPISDSAKNEVSSSPMHTRVNQAKKTLRSTCLEVGL